jgi:hypothetical protein
VHLVEPEKRCPEGSPVPSDRNVARLTRQGRPRVVPGALLQVAFGDTFNYVAVDTDGRDLQMVESPSWRRDRQCFGQGWGDGRLGSTGAPGPSSPAAWRCPSPPCQSVVVVVALGSAGEERWRRLR